MRAGIFRAPALILSWLGLFLPPALPLVPALGLADDLVDCAPRLTSELTRLLDRGARRSPGIDPAAQIGGYGDPTRRARTPVNEAVDLRRLINEEDWTKAMSAPESAPRPWLYYGEATAQDWLDTARWISEGADGRPITLELLQEIHRRAMKNHFFVGAENRRIVAEAKARGLPRDETIETARRVMREKTSPSGRDHAQFRGSLRSSPVDDLPHDGSTLLPGNQRAFTVEEFEAMKRNPYMKLDPEHPPIASADGTSVRTRFRYVEPTRVKAAAEEIIAQLKRDLASARTNEDVILAVVRMNRQMLAAHPFQDGNGRSIRLLGDLVFQRYGLPPALYPNERDLEMTDAEAVQFILRGMRDYQEAHSPGH